LGLEPPAPETNEKEDEMFAGSTIGSSDDFDRVLKILELVGDPVKTKTKVDHTRALAVEFERLAKEQTEHAAKVAAHAASAAELDKKLAARAADLSARESALNAKEDKLHSRELDLERRLEILRRAAA
jgi:hypothetical protein